MKNLVLLITFISFIFSCTPNVNKGSSYVKIEDSLLRIPAIEKYKSYIFQSGYLDKQYAYSDITRISDSTILFACVSAPHISDFVAADLVISKSNDNGQTWSKPQKISHSVNEPFLNISAPAFLNIDKKRILLFFGMKYNVSRIDIMCKESLDGGKTWGEDKVVYAKNQGYQTLNNDRVIFNRGRIIIPIAIPDIPDNLSKSIQNAMSVFYYYSDDMGKTWQKSSKISIDNVALLEPGITAVAPKELLMNIRLNTGKVLFARSFDNGITWNFEFSNIKSPTSPQKIIITKKGYLLMVWNNTDKNPYSNIGNRSPLSVAISKDKGRTWKRVLEIENSENNDFSYPSIYEDKDKFIISYYERYNKTNSYSIKCTQININAFFK